MVEKRGWIAVGILAAGLAGVMILWSMNRSHAAPLPRLGRPGAPAPQAPEAAPGSAQNTPPPARVARPSEATPEVPSATSPGAPDPTGPSAAEQEDRRTLTNRELDSERSAGWRLGQARRQVEMLEARLARFDANAQRLESEGQTDVAREQRTINDRIRQSLEEIRADIPALRAEAEHDGTLGEQQQGYDEGEPAAGDHAPVPVNAPH